MVSAFSGRNGIRGWREASRARSAPLEKVQLGQRKEPFRGFTQVTRVCSPVRACVRARPVGCGSVFEGNLDFNKEKNEPCGLKL